MADAGWYPDPEGRPGHVRYWDGHAWSGEALPVDAPAEPSRPRQQSRRGLWVTLAILGVGALAWGLWGGPGGAVRQDPLTTPQVSVSVWDESPGPTTRAPTPEPTEPTPTGGDAVDCPVVDNVVAEHPLDGRLHGGGLSLGVPAGWSRGGSWSAILTDESGASRSFDGGWASFIAVGLAPSAAGFLDPELTALQVLECHVTSGRFSGYTGHTIETSQEIAVDGRTGWWVRGLATSTQIPGGSATYDVVVVDTGDAEGAAVYWAGAVDADATALADLDDVRADLRLSD